jgi:Uma2 family endonuclease
MAIAPPKRMTWEEYLDRADDETRAGWVDGEIVYMSPVNTSDQDKGRFLIRPFSECLEANPAGFWLKVGCVWPMNRPTMREVRKAWGID